MNIHFSRHAKRQMKWRGISEQEFKHMGKKLLKVTFKQEDDGIIIVTVIDRNK